MCGCSTSRGAATLVAFVGRHDRVSFVGRGMCWLGAGARAAMMAMSASCGLDAKVRSESDPSARNLSQSALPTRGSRGNGKELSEGSKTLRTGYVSNGPGTEWRSCAEISCPDCGCSCFSEPCRCGMDVHRFGTSIQLDQEASTSRFVRRDWESLENTRKCEEFPTFEGCVLVFWLGREQCEVLAGGSELQDALLCGAGSEALL